MQPVIYKFKDFLKEHFAFPVRKLPIHTHLGCPHRENRTGMGGCIYCYNQGFSEISSRVPDVSTQIREGISKSRKNGFTGKLIAYFQTDTNTYADMATLESWWRTVEQFPEDLAGLSVSTRPDCLSEEVFRVLSDIGKTIMVWLELGLQSANDETLKRIHRGHDYACFAKAVRQSKEYPNILVVSHIIFGLPGEGFDDMLYTISELNQMKIHGVKIHHLQVIKNTVLADWYRDGKVNVFTENEYIDLVVRLLPFISKDMVIHRLVGDIKDDLLIAPRWQLPKTQVLQQIETRMRNEGKFQGMNVS